MACARENVTTRRSVSEINEESTSQREQGWALELAGVGEVAKGLRRKRVGHEGHRVYTAVQRYELDPLPGRDLQMGRDDMLHVSASGELNNLSNGGDLRVRIRAFFRNFLDGRLGLDPTSHDGEAG